MIKLWKCQLIATDLTTKKLVKAAVEGAVLFHGYVVLTWTRTQKTSALPSAEVELYDIVSGVIANLGASQLLCKCQFRAVHLSSSSLWLGPLLAALLTAPLAAPLAALLAALFDSRCSARYSTRCSALYPILRIFAVLSCAVLYCTLLCSTLLYSTFCCALFYSLLSSALLYSLRCTAMFSALLCSLSYSPLYFSLYSVLLCSTTRCSLLFTLYVVIHTQIPSPFFFSSTTQLFRKHALTFFFSLNMIRGYLKSFSFITSFRLYFETSLHEILINHIWDLILMRIFP